MFRTRDFIALFAALLLTRMAWNTDLLDAVGASVHLSWYLPVHFGEDAASTIRITPQLLDIDGDGYSEALVVVADDKRLRIMDLRKASLQQWVMPFVPPLIIQSAVVSLPSDAHPLYLATGHVAVKEAPDGKKDAKHAAKPNDLRDDKTRYYYCGKDWHDSSKCHVHCPNGLSSECPDGETCYADTSCDALALQQQRQDNDDLQQDVLFTPQGSLPAAATLWENGAVTMHALAVSNTTRNIHFFMLWETNLLANYTILNWENQHLQMVGAAEAGNGHGLVLLTASVDIDYRNGEEPLRVAFVAAINAKTGSVQWESLSENQALHPPPKLPLPLQDDSRSSIARRRSLRFKMNQQSTVAYKDNCLHFYRRSVLTSGVLPFLYWNHAYVQSKPLHFDAQQKLSKLHYHAKDKRTQRKGSLFAGKNKKSSSRQQPILHLGKPNVVATANEDGLQLRSLKNGRLLCHLSLWEETLYTDLNHDGAIDSVNMITGRRSLRDDDTQGEERKWVSELVGRVAKIQGDKAAIKEVREDVEKQAIIEAHLCHVNALSGVPARETLFSTNVCGPSHLNDVEDVGYAMSAPPLAVEAIHGHGNDIIAAVSTGFVTRVHGSNGRIVWQANLGQRQDFPTWEDDADASITRVHSTRLVTENQPVLLIAENSLAIVSVRHGKLLALSAFPQLATERPRVCDFNGDETSDIIVRTDDAVWGYAIHIQAGTSLFFRLSVGLLMMLTMLALLRNRFGPEPGRRSSDA